LGQPAADFWTTDPRHFWWLMEAEDEATPGLSKADRDELLQMVYEAQDNG
jgi:hypothetical protein